MWQSFLLQMAGVAATASLVVSNKFVLEEISMPCAAAVLVLAHNVGTMLVMRARGCLQDGQAKKVDCRWLLAVNILGSFAVLMSNVVLQHSTVTFHQLARLTAIPASAVVDYALDAKRCSPLQRVGLVTMCLGVVRAASGEVSGVTGATCAAAAAMVAGTLAVAVLTRIVCKREQVTTAEFMYHARDWQSNPIALAMTPTLTLTLTLTLTTDHDLDPSLRRGAWLQLRSSSPFVPAFMPGRFTVAFALAMISWR